MGSNHRRKGEPMTTTTEYVPLCDRTPAERAAWYALPMNQPSKPPRRPRYVGESYDDYSLQPEVDLENTR